MSAINSATSGSGRGPQLLDGVAAEDHHRQAQFPGEPSPARRRRARVSEGLAAEERDPFDPAFFLALRDPLGHFVEASSSARP